jgi:hypothetical protein
LISGLAGSLPDRRVYLPDACINVRQGVRHLHLAAGGGEQQQQCGRIEKRGTGLGCCVRSQRTIFARLLLGAPLRGPIGNLVWVMSIAKQIGFTARRILQHCRNFPDPRGFGAGSLCDESLIPKANPDVADKK